MKISNKMIFKITYEYDWKPKEFYFETPLSFEEVEFLIEKWIWYVYNKDMNFVFASENMSVLLNTYKEINFYDIKRNIDKYEIEEFNIWYYQDGCEVVDLDFNKEDNIRKILIAKMMKDFYEVKL